MNRREAIRNTSIFLGAASMGVITTQLASCKVDTSDKWEPIFLSLQESNLLNELAETILPATDTPGAKDAMVVRYLDEYAKNFLKPEEQTEYKSALAVIENLAKGKFEKDFTKLSIDQRGQVLQSMIDDPAEGDTSPSSIFYDLRDAITTAFFTSEVGATQVLDYDPIPGNYDGDIALTDTKGLIYSG